MLPPTEGVRFEERVEVFGKAPMDGAALTARLEGWLMSDGSDLTRGSSAAFGSPTNAEMLDFRPHPARSANLVPLLSWLAQLAEKKRRP